MKRREPRRVPPPTTKQKRIQELERKILEDVVGGAGTAAANPVGEQRD